MVNTFMLAQDFGRSRPEGHIHVPAQSRSLPFSARPVRYDDYMQRKMKTIH